MQYITYVLLKMQMQRMFKFVVMFSLKDLISWDNDVERCYFLRSLNLSDLFSSIFQHTTFLTVPSATIFLKSDGQKVLKSLKLRK